MHQRENGKGSKIFRRLNIDFLFIFHIFFFHSREFSVSSGKLLKNFLLREKVWKFVWFSIWKIKFFSIRQEIEREIIDGKYFCLSRKSGKWKLFQIEKWNDFSILTFHSDVGLRKKDKFWVEFKEKDEKEKCSGFPGNLTRIPTFPTPARMNQK